MPPASSTQLHDLLTPSTVRVGMEAASKEEVLDQLIGLLADNPAVEDLDKVREAVLQREEMMSTGVGKGLALPHAKTSGVQRTVAAFAITSQPVDFNAIDDEPVRLFFLLVGNEEARSQHIRILSRISRLLNQDAFRERLLRADSAEAVIAIFEEGDLQLVEGYR